MRVSIDLTSAEINPDDLMGASWRRIVRGSLLQLEPDIPRSQRRAYFVHVHLICAFWCATMSSAIPNSSTGNSSLQLPFSDPLDQFAKGQISRDTPEDRRRVSNRQIEWFDKIKAEGLVSKPFTGR